MPKKRSANRRKSDVKSAKKMTATRKAFSRQRSLIKSKARLKK